MNARITVVCHLWPCITPWNIYDLQWHHWRRFAAEADAWVEANEKASKP